MRIANVHNVRNIEYSSSGIRGTGSLSPRARRTLYVYVVLAKMGYDAVSSPMGAISDAVYRTSAGEASSIRTLQRANSELQEAGYIDVKTLRCGKYSNGALIFFNIGSFSYWLQRRKKNVLPLPFGAKPQCKTMCEVSSDTTSCRTSDLTTDNYRVNYQKDLTNKKEKPRASARANDNNNNNKNTNTKREKRNAVLFSLMKVLQNSDKFCRADKRLIRARAECEVKAIIAGIELSHPSGIDWIYWDKRFPDMGIDVRESTIRREILPLLLSTKSFAEISESQTTIPESTPTPTPEEIKKIRQQLEAKFSIVNSKKIEKTEENILGSDDLEILLAAKFRAASVNG